METEKKTVVEEQSMTDGVIETGIEVAAIEQGVIAQDLSMELEEARAKAQQHWNQLLRMRADMENLQKRQARELENAHKFALDSFVRELLQVWDSLELGQSAAGAADADLMRIKEGIELTIKMFKDVMSKFGVERLDPLGMPFNPAYHQAISVQLRDDLEANHVAIVMQKGCTLNGRVVRPALVIVSQALTKPLE